MRVLALTSGGDAPGMNMVLAYLFVKFKFNLYVARAGFRGLINNDITKITDFEPLKNAKKAGSCIKCSRCSAFATEEGFAKGLENAKRFDVIVVLGGNGSYRGCQQLAESGVRTIFIPATIDNDVANNDYSLGYHTAVDACENTINNTMPSIDAMDRCVIFEVMGRHCPRIASCVYHKSQADYLITSKKDINYPKIVEIVKNKHELGQASSIILQENIIKMQTIVKNINKLYPELEVRTVKIGHVQRGSAPTSIELEFAKGFARKAIEAITKKDKSYAILYRQNKFVLEEFKEENK